MVSAKQLVANRRNAILSTGPKSEIGVKASSMNALKHGLLATECAIDANDSKELEVFALGMRKSLQPQNELENLLVERIISYAWRLKRVLKIESHLFNSKDAWSTCLSSFSGLSFEGEKVEKALLLSRYEIALERSLYRALNELRHARAMMPTNGFVS